jgi:hypothetical protein
MFLNVEIRDYVVLQKPRDLTDCLPPPCTLILDFTLTHTRFGKSQMSSLGQLTHTRRTDGVPDPDGALRTVARAKIRHYRQLYINRPEPIAFIPVAVDTADRVACFANIKGSVGLILAKTSAMWISIPLDLSSRSFILLGSRVSCDLDVSHHFHIIYIGFS